MMMEFRLCVLLLALAAVAVTAQRRRPNTDEWNYRDGSEKVNMRGVANLTQILDNWRFDILAQMQSMMQNDMQGLLPDYTRIQPLSEALDDLFKEFNALKTHLGDLSEKVVSIEAFIDDVKAGKLPNTAPAGPAGPAGPAKKKIIRKKVPAPAPAP
ncbi:uncharacterized protein si:ch211-76l23.4 [Brienomyrus brachyistius]|uniref:uncharacterized protein si:ch211-76l23.4 n=1 Tax=Brienomyrus brachyistius TaxID=42636 RepID=UPI0020B324CE|nr:uncharacterized protein si:ch211-76l23.4 [Brienomyrus brachyistius]XP_048860505.1 uncharacterized protein si:ch211-76l23.4 [Brienomyrus brachyistius]